MDNLSWTILAAVLGALGGYLWGESEGVNKIHYRDHVQAKAGFFIDGHDRNKVYRLSPAEQ